jgi:hypothetical protein
MAIDTEYLRRHYASLSDEALHDIDRDELVEEARKCYDAEMKQRALAAPEGESFDDEEPVDDEIVVDGETPEWMDDALAVYSWIIAPGTTPAHDAADARDALTAAGIPCFLEEAEIEREEEKPLPPRVTQLRLLVPGNLNLWATSVLERDIFNHDFETDWRTHLEALSDQELRTLNPKEAFCGLFDKIERVTKAYNEEIGRRRLKR